jgi:predicted extracellular nuclease
MSLSVESRRWLIALSAVLMLLLVVPAVPVVGAGHLTPIYDIQGAGHISPEDGNSVVTQGVITAIGFQALYVQDPNGDGDDATSDAIFVFDFGFGSRSVGECVELTGSASEFIGGGPATGNLSTTQMFAPGIDVIDCEATFGPGYSFPSPVVIGLGGRTPPNVIVISEDEIDPPINLQGAIDDAANNFNPDVDGIDFYESLEAMLVTVQDAQAVSATRRFSTFSAEFFTVPNRGDRAIIEPNSVMTQRGGILLQPHPDGTGDLNPERVQIQLSGTPLYPGDMNLQVKVGDWVGDVTGVVGYSFGNFEINALHEITVVDGGLTDESTSLNITDNRLSVASYNVLNLSVAGTGDMAQADALGAQIVNNMESPDVIALQEIQDDSAETDDGTTTAEATLQMLVNAIVSAGGPTYVAFDVAPDDNTQGGVPGGNIRTAFLYNPDRIDLLGFTALTSDLLIEAGADPTAFDGTRIPLVGTFEMNGSEFTVISVHNTSRFGSTPIFGGPQPFVQAGEAEREAETTALNQYVDFLLESDSNAQVMVVGDFNTFEWTDELLEDMPGPEPALNNLVPFKDKNPNSGNQIGQEGFYSFIFDGNSQMLDHFFVTSSLLPSAKFDVVHLNVDFPRTFINTTASDHEPLLATFSLAK